MLLSERGDRGWVAADAIVALIVLTVIVGGIGGVAAGSVRAAAKFRERVSAIIADRNEHAETLLTLLSK